MVSRAIINGWPLVPPSKQTVEPQFTTLPSISGTSSVGNTLTASPGVVIGFPTPAIAYQWLRNGQAVAGATSATYALVDADVGTDVTCRVTASSARGTAQYTPTPVTVAHGG